MPLSDYQISLSNGTTTLTLGGGTDYNIVSNDALWTPKYYKDRVSRGTTSYGVSFTPRTFAERIMKIPVHTDTSSYATFINDLRKLTVGTITVNMKMPEIGNSTETSNEARLEVKGLTGEKNTWGYLEVDLIITMSDSRFTSNAVSSLAIASNSQVVATSNGSAPCEWWLAKTDDTTSTLPPDWCQISFDDQGDSVRMDQTTHETGLYMFGFSSRFTSGGEWANTEADNELWDQVKPSFIEGTSTWTRLNSGNNNITVTMDGTFQPVTLYWRDAWL